MQPQRIPASALLLSSMLLPLPSQLFLLLLLLLLLLAGHRKHWKIEHGNEREKSARQRQQRVTKKWLAKWQRKTSSFKASVVRLSANSLLCRCPQLQLSDYDCCLISYAQGVRQSEGTFRSRENPSLSQRTEDGGRRSLRLVKCASRRAICCCAKWSNYCNCSSSNSCR